MTSITKINVFVIFITAVYLKQNDVPIKKEYNSEH